MKKVLLAAVAVCVVFAAAAFAQTGSGQGWGNHENHGYQNHQQQEMNCNGQQGNSCQPDGQFEGHGPRHGGQGHYGRGGFGFGRHYGFTPDMPKEIREKAVELAKLRVDLEEAMSSNPINKAKALDTYAKMQKFEQEIKMWRFAQRLERMEDFRKQMELNKKNFHQEEMHHENEAKDAPAK